MIPSYGSERIDRVEDGDITLYSVTSILNALNDGDGLVWWASREAAKWAVEHQDAWAPLAAEVPGKAVNVIADAHRETSDLAKNRGNAVHDLLETYAIQGTRPDPICAFEDGTRFDGTPYLDSFDRWAQAAQPSYEAAEMTVYSPRYGYAGTLDAVVTIDGVRFVMDYKSKDCGYDRDGRPVKPRPASAALQVCAYARAEMAAVFRARRLEQKFSPRLYALSPDEQARAVPVPEVDAGLIVMVSPELTMAYPMRIDDQVFRSFLYAIEAYRWVKHTSKTVMGGPLLVEEVNGAHHRTPAAST